MNQGRPLTFAILGGGGRGNGFSQWLYDRPDMGRVVAVAEVLAERRKRIAQRHGIPADTQFEKWEDLLSRPKLADVVLNTLMDRLHAPSAIKALDAGYHMLLEKPMATTLEECVAIDEACRRNNRIVSVCHSLRYTQIYSEIKRLITEGAIGELVSLDALEGVDFIHQSHSFVRGNWGNEDRSTFMLLAKSCHDMDIIEYLVGKECKRVSSFGSLSYFTSANAPAGAPMRCVDGCPVEHECVYSAIKIYLHGSIDWAPHAGFGGKSFEEKWDLLKTSPYGRCVYHCDNDVVDHQVVNFEFDGGITGTFTMTAFDLGGRRLRLHGTQGAMYCQIEPGTIELHRFRDRSVQTIKIPPQPGGHSGGGDNIMRNLILAVRTNNPDLVLTPTSESLRTHKIAFAAEKARRENRVVELSELAG